MSYKLFLDDEREPVNPDEWVVVRTVKDFKKALWRLGPPALVTFDHDLGISEGDGAFCAQTLINMDLQVWGGEWNGKYEVHSQNPVGANNIRFDIDGYLRLRGSML